jgi:hypothetical protein
MKYSKTFFLAWLIVGLFNIPTQSQSVAEAPQFHFPLEVGNVWTYHRLPDCDSSPVGCAFERWEIIGIPIAQSDSTCVEFDIRKEVLVINGTDVNVQTSHEDQYMCVTGNNVYWRFEGRGQPPNDTMLRITDFDLNEGDKWTVWKYEEDFPLFWLRKVDYKSEEQPFEWYFLDYSAESEDEDFVDITSGGGFSDIPWGFTDGIGITGLGYYSYRGSLIDGVLSGDTISFTQRFLTNIEPNIEERIDEGPMLLNNYPNPFNPSTVVSYRLSVFGDVKINVMNLLGQHVATLFDGVQAPGQHSVTFDAAGLPSGMYIVVLESGGMRDVRKVTLLK